MKNGPVYADRAQRWFEPAHALLGAEYFTHAWGSLYVLSGRAAAAAAALPPGALRFFNNEGARAPPGAPSVCRAAWPHASESRRAACGWERQHPGPGA